MILIRPDTASDFKAQGRNSITELTLLHNCCTKVIDHGLEYNSSIQAVVRQLLLFRLSGNVQMFLIVLTCVDSYHHQYIVLSNEM